MLVAESLNREFPWEIEKVDAVTFEEMLKDGHRPALPALLGLPLLVLQRRCGRLTPAESFENDAITCLCVHPTSGFAPPRWQTRVGPCTVARVDRQPFTAQDAYALDCYINHLIDLWPVCPPSKFQLSSTAFVGYIHRMHGQAHAKRMRANLVADAPGFLRRGRGTAPLTPPPEIGPKADEQAASTRASDAPRLPDLAPPPPRAHPQTPPPNAGTDDCPSEEQSELADPAPGPQKTGTLPQYLGSAPEPPAANTPWSSQRAAVVAAMGCAAGAVLWKAAR